MTDLVILHVATLPTTTRPEARTKIRQALRNALATHLGSDAEIVPIISQVGGGLALGITNCSIGLSVSHEVGISLGAINLQGAVGIDLMRVDLKLEWRVVARDYLGPAAYQRIAANLEVNQARAFALEWVAFEACLKCYGVGLQEWSLEVLSILRHCSVKVLDLPTGFVGAVATKL